MVRTRKAASTYPTEGQPTEKLLLPKSGNLPPAKLGCEYPTCLGPNRIWNRLSVFKGWLLLFTFLLTFCFPFHLSFVPWIPVFVDGFLRAISLPFLACFLDYQHWCLILQDFVFVLQRSLPSLRLRSYFDRLSSLITGVCDVHILWTSFHFCVSWFAASVHFPMAYLIFYNLFVYTCTTQSLPHLAAGFCFHFFSCHCSGVAVLGMHCDNLKLEGGWGRAHRPEAQPPLLCLLLLLVLLLNDNNGDSYFVAESSLLLLFVFVLLVVCSSSSSSSSSSSYCRCSCSRSLVKCLYSLRWL